MCVCVSVCLSVCVYDYKNKIKTNHINKHGADKMDYYRGRVG